MSTEEERTVISDVENAKKSDETSTAGEHNPEKIDQQQSDGANKIPTDEIDTKDDERVDSSVINEKMKVIEPSSTDVTNEEKPNEELTVV